MQTNASVFLQTTAVIFLVQVHNVLVAFSVFVIVLVFGMLFVCFFSIVVYESMAFVGLTARIQKRS